MSMRMKLKFFSFLLLLLVAGLNVSGCSGGGAAFGLLGVAAENAFDDDDPKPGTTTDDTPVTVTGAVEVAGAGAPGLHAAPSRAFGANGDTLEVWSSTNLSTYTLVAQGLVSGGTYSVSGPFRGRHVRLRHLRTGHHFAIGRVSDDATAVAVPIAFDTVAVILSKVLVKQGGLSTLVCGSAATTNLRKAVTDRLTAKGVTAMTYLATVTANDATISADFPDIAKQGFKELLTQNQWNLGTIEVAGAERTQVLSLYATNFFTFTLLTATSSVYLTGTYVTDTASVECTITSVTGFPTGDPFASMDAAGEKFKIESVAIVSRDRLRAAVGGRSVTMSKYVAP